jgi:hypothetical protein
MVELAFLVLLNRLTSWGRAPVIASGAILTDAATLLAIVSDPAGQWRIVEAISPHLRPTASVQPSTSKRIVRVRVQVAGHDVLWISWILVPRRGTTDVDLTAQLHSRSLLARLVLLLGGRYWLRRRLERTLRTLALIAHRAAEDLDAVEPDGEVGAARPPRGPISQAGR